jgi:hypothetical protein
MYPIFYRTSRITTAVATAMVVALPLLFTGGCAADAPTAEGSDAPLRAASERGRLEKHLSIGALAGVWSVEHVEVFAKEGLSSLSSDGAAAIRDTWSHTDRTNALLREQRLKILHTLKADGTYVHTLDWADAPQRRVEESGTWTIDGDGVIRCVNSTGEASSLPEARVLSMDETSLIVRMDFSGLSGGQAEIIRHRRLTSAQDGPVAHPPAHSTGLHN